MATPDARWAKERRRIRRSRGGFRGSRYFPQVMFSLVLFIIVVIFVGSIVAVNVSNGHERARQLREYGVLQLPDQPWQQPFTAAEINHARSVLRERPADLPPQYTAAMVLRAKVVDRASRLCDAEDACWEALVVYASDSGAPVAHDLNAYGDNLSFVAKCVHAGSIIGLDLTSMRENNDRDPNNLSNLNMIRLPKAEACT